MRDNRIVDFEQEFGTIPLSLHLLLSEPRLLKILRIVNGDGDLRPNLSQKLRVVFGEGRLPQARQYHSADNLFVTY